ncbi:MAG TPA: hypothetical protein VLB44_12635 [Kofleriaceae bacterium]|nr:hypothetical protein [Kofleriaceae bacterium]
MQKRLGVVATALTLPVVLLAGAACDKDKLKGPEAEVKKTDVKLDLPAVPAFDLPPAPADGSHSVKELRVKGRKLLDTELTVHGFVTWAYDCKTAIRKPDEDDKALQARIDEDPTLCERPKFYIGDTAQTPPEKSLWIVDVPRPYNTLEIKRIKKKDRIEPDRCEPDELAKKPMESICPPYAVGDEVEITGKFSTSSPHSERNSDGLIAFKSMKNITKGYESPPPKELPPGMGSAAGGPPPPAGSKPSPEDLVKKK